MHYWNIDHLATNFRRLITATKTTECMFTYVYLIPQHMLLIRHTPTEDDVHD